MRNDWTTVEVLRHARHDWLNKIQLIKGNLALNKVDRVKEIIDEIVIEAQQETKLSNLNIPQFASMLLTYNWNHHSIHLEYEILEETKHQKYYINDDQLTKWTIAFLENLQTSVKEFAENHLSITIDPRDTGIRFFFDFRGIIIEQEQITSFLQKADVEKSIEELSEIELALEVFFPKIG